MFIIIIILLLLLLSFFHLHEMSLTDGRTDICKDKLTLKTGSQIAGRGVKHKNCAQNVLDP